MIWTLIVQICEMDMADEILDDCDNAEIQEIKSTYGNIINIRSEDFELVSKVIGLFTRYKEETGKSSKDFIKEKYSSIEEEFSNTNLPEEDKKCLIQLIIKKILSNRYNIDKIKGIANL